MKMKHITESKKTYRLNLVTMQTDVFDSMMDASRGSNIKVTTMKNRIHKAIIDEKTGYFFSHSQVSDELADELKDRFDRKDCGTRVYNRCVYAYDLDLKLIKFYSNIAECASDNCIYHKIVSKCLTRNECESNSLLPHNGIIYKARPIEENTDYTISKKTWNSKVKQFRHDKVEFDKSDVVIDRLELDFISIRNYTGANVKVCFEAAVKDSKGAISGFKLTEIEGEFSGIVEGSNYRLNKIQLKTDKNITEIQFFAIKSIEIVKFSQYLAKTIRDLFEVSSNNETSNTLLSYAEALSLGKYPIVPYFDVYCFTNLSSLGQKVLKADFKGISEKKLKAILRLQKDLNNFAKANNDAIKTNK